MRILALTDLNKVGSGYMSLSLPIFMELTEAGHEVKVLGLFNDGGQHNFPFSIIPAANVKEALQMIRNMWQLWKFDVLLVLIDLSVQTGLLNSFGNRPFKYIGVFPIESDPLSYSWAMTILQMDKAFIISDFGTKEAHKKGITNAEHLPVGIDTSAWQSPTEEERAEVRKAYGFDDDTFVVLTVADNQERKNLPANFEAFSQFSEKVPNSKYVLVTREKLYAGWNLKELADTLGISDKLIILERGMSFGKLWTVYAAADALLLLSKAEGAGLPVYEAMAMKVPVIGTNCTGIRDSLSDGRGLLVGWEYMHIDPFANGNRYWADPCEAAKHLQYLYDMKGSKEVSDMVERAHKFVSERTWEISVVGMLKTLEEIKHEQENTSQQGTYNSVSSPEIILTGDGSDPRTQ